MRLDTELQLEKLLKSLNKLVELALKLIGEEVTKRKP